MPASQVPDGFELKKDGTIRLVVDGSTWQLHRPTLGDYRKIKETLQGFNAKRLELVAAMGELPPKPTEDAAPDEKRDYALSVNRRSYELAAGLSDLQVQWLAEAMGLLVDRPLPPSDDWPAGMDSLDVMTMLVEHWRSTPLLSGGS